MASAAATLSALRQRIAAIEAADGSATVFLEDVTLAHHGAASPTAFRPADPRIIPIDRGDIDARLGGGLARGALHEFHPATAGDQAAASAFAAILAFRTASADSPILWVRQEQAAREGGELHADGLAALGLDPARLILVRLAKAVSVLRAGVEVARSSAVGAALIEPWGSPKELDLTTQRRLVLAAESSGVTLFLLRPGAEPAAGSAETRWTVRSSPAAALAMNAPGRPTFALTLLRHRHGAAGGPWRLEWNRDEQSFEPAPLLRDPPALPRLRPAAAPAEVAIPGSAGRQAAPDRGEAERSDAPRRAGSGRA